MGPPALGGRLVRGFLDLDQVGSEAELEAELPEAAQAEQESGFRVRVVLVDQGLGLAVDAVLVRVGGDPHVEGDAVGGVESVRTLRGDDGRVSVEVQCPAAYPAAPYGIAVGLVAGVIEDVVDGVAVPETASRVTVPARSSKSQRAEGLPGARRSWAVAAGTKENGTIAPPTAADTALRAVLLLMADSWVGAAGLRTCQIGLGDSSASLARRDSQNKSSRTPIYPGVTWKPDEIAYNSPVSHSKCPGC